MHHTPHFAHFTISAICKRYKLVLIAVAAIQIYIYIVCITAMSMTWFTLRDRIVVILWVFHYIGITIICYNVCIHFRYQNIRPKFVHNRNQNFIENCLIWTFSQVFGWGMKACSCKHTPTLTHTMAKENSEIVECDHLILLLMIYETILHTKMQTISTQNSVCIVHRASMSICGGMGGRVWSRGQRSPKYMKGDVICDCEMRVNWTKYPNTIPIESD